ncbi:MAG: hypothetical protein DMD67_00525 [Gemmatimonadetes bacterium]|nr:MAG: hypothetical protein DMD67_00525 [Gemmatimonadota bacterium]
MSPLTHAGSIRSPTLSWLTKGALLVAVYFIVARLGLRYATIGESISPVWPPTGLALAALLLLGPRYWPAILCGAFLANATTAVPLTATAGIACGNAAEAALGAYLIRRSFGGQRIALDKPGAVRALVAIAAPLGALASASVGVTTLYLCWWWRRFCSPGPPRRRSLSAGVASQSSFCLLAVPYSSPSSCWARCSPRRSCPAPTIPISCSRSS